MGSPDAAEIARRLSPAQRKALLKMLPNARWWQRAPHRARWAMPFCPLMNTEERLWKLTPLGLAVRAELEKESSDAA